MLPDTLSISPLESVQQGRQQNKMQNINLRIMNALSFRDNAQFPVLKLVQKLDSK
jgi:hypothetical protein